MIAKGEQEQLNKSFKTYELFYYTITTIAYLCTLILIVPFVQVYTYGIEDANYIRPVFATILVLAEFLWSIRLPYSGITLAAGHFKETQKGAWVEAISNIVISIILVWKYGIIGVAIGTLVAMLIRTIEFMYHTNKYILKRKQQTSFFRVGVIIIQGIITILIAELLPNYEFTNYFTWIIYALEIFTIASIVVIPINAILYRNEVKDFKNIIKNLNHRQKGKQNCG